MYETFVKVSEKQKLVFKFIVNEVNWQVSDSFKDEFDEHGNRNNYVEACELTPYEEKDTEEGELSETASAVSQSVAFSDEEVLTKSLELTEAADFSNAADTSQPASQTGPDGGEVDVDSLTPREAATGAIDTTTSVNLQSSIPERKVVESEDAALLAGPTESIEDEPAIEFIMSVDGPESALDEYQDTDCDSGNELWQGNSSLVHDDDDKENMVYLLPSESSFTQLSFVTSDTKLYSQFESLHDMSYSKLSHGESFESTADDCRSSINTTGVLGIIEGAGAANNILEGLSEQEAGKPGGIFGRLLGFFRR